MNLDLNLEIYLEVYIEAVGLADDPKNGGTLKKAASMANHASTRTKALRPVRR